MSVPDANDARRQWHLLVLQQYYIITHVHGISDCAMVIILNANTTVKGKYLEGTSKSIDANAFI
jgi:hypothetical protein